MAGKRRTVRKGSAARPFLLALAAVAAVFGAGLAVSLLTEKPKPAVTARAPVAESAPAPVAVTESEPALPYEEPDPPAAEPPPQVAVLPPPPPPSGTQAPWLRNAVPAPPSAGRPVIAVVIDDLGLDRKRSARTVKLPAPLTLAWLPYAQDLREQTKAAHAAGHELMLHIPMEPSVQADPGPEALLVRLSRDEIVRRFANALASFDGYVGVNNHMGSRFTADRAAMAPVLAEVQRRGLLWLDSRTSPSTVAATLAGELKLPFAGRDVFLDNVETVSAVRAQLAKTEAVARQHGSAIAIGHPHDATVEALAAWLPEVRKRGFVLVPVSAVVRARCACG
ncbi:divergent polysaccharide deacetylase family protein [Azospirillum sp. TSO22-1]|uniref:divergent polysaccharide deacetylase family protein n=1 Tax=Azospirillum sp. TSO22-1 TaxID=716789 RepID=UPI000D60CA69|nr:divergent polysaccharide deacetylase family protein [Azospirillum sp. TSO22-1]PWC55817.1 hypothetical protein TSO221_03655 [Azospirillum sp. TSO22-1]